MIKSNSKVKYKSLPAFFIAANSLLLAGYITNRFFLTPQLFLMLWLVINGVFIVYRFNDFVDQSADFRFSLKRFFEIKMNLLFTLQFVLITIPLSFVLLSNFQFLVLAFLAFIGIVYSLNININQIDFRLKKIFIIKNLLIGFSWGALVFVGADTFFSEFTQAIFLFCFLQVFIGSVVRDIPDIKKDKEEGVKSLPVIYGISKTIFILLCINLISILVNVITKWQFNFLVITLIIIAWRFYLLLKIKKGVTSPSWTQTYNLMTCFLIFVLILITKLYANYHIF